MFGTIIQDAYTESEKEEIAYVLNDICNPNDYSGWASAGIYCFWDYETREVLYIGLARDFSERFKQHNGLVSCNPKSCKIEYINDYFSKNEKLGYSIFVQSPLHQPITIKNIFDLFCKDSQTVNIRDFEDEPVKQDYKIVEGILIEAYKKTYNKIPIWNRISGSKEGQLASSIDNYEIIKVFTSMNPSPLLARYTIREISNNPTYERYETFLHAARQRMLSTGCSYLQALEILKAHDMLNTYGELITEKYYCRKLEI